MKDTQSHSSKPESSGFYSAPYASLHIMSKMRFKSSISRVLLAGCLLAVLAFGQYNKAIRSVYHPLTYKSHTYQTSNGHPELPVGVVVRACCKCAKNHEWIDFCPENMYSRKT